MPALPIIANPAASSQIRAKKSACDACPRPGFALKCSAGFFPRERDWGCGRGLRDGRVTRGKWVEFSGWGFWLQVGGIFACFRCFQGFLGGLPVIRTRDLRLDLVDLVIFIHLVILIYLLLFKLCICRYIYFMLAFIYSWCNVWKDFYQLNKCRCRCSQSPKSNSALSEWFWKVFGKSSLS